MTYFIKNGSQFAVTDDANIDIQKRLPAGTYTIKETMQHGLVLQQIDDFQNPSKIYGTTLRSVDRIVNTFLDRPAGTGVMLAGYKGSGKTLLARALAVECKERDIPCIVINAPWAGDQFNKLLQSISQPCMVLFDEFEKVYPREAQPGILTLLDGVFPSKKLYVMTCNDKYRVDDHMRNRPGRLFYVMDFDGIDEAFIRDYCNDVLKNKSYIDQVCNVSMMFSPFTFDMLKALVEEMNRYNETAKEVMQILNARPDTNCRSLYDVFVRMDGEMVEATKTVYVSPLADDFTLYIGKGSAGRDEDGRTLDGEKMDITDLLSDDGELDCDAPSPPTPPYALGLVTNSPQYSVMAAITEAVNPFAANLKKGIVPVKFSPNELTKVDSKIRRFTFVKTIKVKNEEKKIRLDLSERRQPVGNYWGAF